MLAYCWLNHVKQTSVNFQSKDKSSNSRKCIYICSLQNGIRSVLKILINWEIIQQKKIDSNPHPICVSAKQLAILSSLISHIQQYIYIYIRKPKCYLFIPTLFKVTPTGALGTTYDKSWDHPSANRIPVISICATIYQFRGLLILLEPIAHKVAELIIQISKSWCCYCLMNNH